MVLRLEALALALLPVLAGCVATIPQTPEPAPIAGEPVSFFNAPVVVDGTRRAFEPGMVAGPDGLVVVCAPRGVGRGTDLWRSLNHGATFEYVGLLGQEAAGVRTPVVRSGSGDLGGGDCDLAIDAAGTLYLADLWAGSTSVAVSRDRGATWEGVPVSQTGTLHDRPWLLGGAGGELFLITREGTSDPIGQLGGVWVLRSTDSGRTFPQQVKVITNEARSGVHGNLARAGTVIAFPYDRELGGNRLGLRVATSHDDGRTWTSTLVAEQEMLPTGCSGLVIFPVLAGDASGSLYFAWAMQRAETARIDLFLSVSRDRGATWSQPVLLTDRPGARAFPWIAASPEGRVVVAWYETNASALLDAADPPVTCVWKGADDAEWYLRYAILEPSGGGEITWTEGLVQPEPVHKGELDRPYAERLQVAMLPDGRAAIAYVADVPEGEARPMFALEAPSQRGSHAPSADGSGALATPLCRRTPGARCGPPPGAPSDAAAQFSRIVERSA